MKVHQWLMGQDLKSHERWSVVLRGNMPEIIHILEQFPSQDTAPKGVDLEFYQGDEIGFVRYVISEVPQSYAEALFNFIDSVYGAYPGLITAYAGWHGGSYTGVGAL